MYGGRGGREPRPQAAPAGSWRLAADLQAATAAGGSADGYTATEVTVACAAGSEETAKGAGAGATQPPSSRRPTPLLTDAEMTAQYSAVYARARRARAASRGATLAAVPVGALLFATAGALVGLPWAASRAARRRRVARGRGEAAAVAGAAPGVAGLLFGVKRDHAQ